MGVNERKYYTWLSAHALDCIKENGKLSSSNKGSYYIDILAKHHLNSSTLITAFSTVEELKDIDTDGRESGDVLVELNDGIFRLPNVNMPISTYRALEVFCEIEVRRLDVDISSLNEYEMSELLLDVTGFSKRYFNEKPVVYEDEEYRIILCCLKPDMISGIKHIVE